MRKVNIKARNNSQGTGKAVGLTGTKVSTSTVNRVMSSPERLEATTPKAA